MPRTARGAAKIAVLRANGVGDFIFALPSLDALRAAYPQAEIVLLGRQWHRDFLQGRPGPIDRVIVVPPCHGVGDPRPEAPRSTSSELEPFFTTMRAEAFDLALQMHGGGRNSNPFVARLGARLSAGWRDTCDDAPALDRWARYDYWQREVLRCLEAVALVGAPPVTLEPTVTLLEAEHRAAARQLAKGTSQDSAGRARGAGHADPGPLVVLHPGGGTVRRRWSTQRFAQLGNALADAGARLVITGGPGEEGLARSVAHRLTRPALNLAGRTTLGELGAIFAGADLVVANDSGSLHLARAVGARTVGLYWSGNVINAGPMSSNHHRVLLSWTRICPCCGQDHAREPCACQVSFVDEITVPEVERAAFDLLARPN